MNRERSLKIVRRHTPLSMPPGAAGAGLTAAVAIVLSTYRSGAGSMVLDHELWLACIQAVSRVVKATNVQVHSAPARRFLEFLRRPCLGPLLASLHEYGERLSNDTSEEKDESDLWEVILWWNGNDLVAAASREAWYAVGGPPLYHDSYTSSIQVKPALRDELASAIEAEASRAGGWVEAIVEDGKSA